VLRIAGTLDADRLRPRRARERAVTHASESAEQKLLELRLHER
jgi:hypothetical protein